MKTYTNVSLAQLSTLLALVLIGPMAAHAVSPATVNLGASGNFTILAKTGISTTGSTSVVGDIGVSPAAATYITGFAPTLPAAGAYSTSALVTGKVYAPGYADPTPANLSTAVLDMQTAYTAAMGRAPDSTELGAGNIGGLTLVPGVYKWGTGVTIPTDVTLAGGANDVWIFQIAQNLTVSAGKRIILSGGAQANNIFWIVAGQTTIGTTAIFNGNILDQTAIVLNTGATLTGRALAQTAVTLDSNTVTTPTTYSAPAYSPPTPPAYSPTPTYTPPVYTPPTSSTPPSTSTLCPNGMTSASNCTISSAPASSGQQVRLILSTLRQGSRGTNVTILQQFLIAQNKGSAAQALARVGATAYFGILTHAALAEFQANTGLQSDGIMGPMTRAYVSAHY